MRLVWLGALVIIASGGVAHAACEDDADCKGDRVCDQGQCVAALAAVSCSADVDCPGELVCEAGSCLAAVTSEPPPSVTEPKPDDSWDSLIGEGEQKARDRHAAQQRRTRFVIAARTGVMAAEDFDHTTTLFSGAAIGVRKPFSGSQLQVDVAVVFQYVGIDFGMDGVLSAAFAARRGSFYVGGGAQVSFNAVGAGPVMGFHVRRWLDVGVRAFARFIDFDSYEPVGFGLGELSVQGGLSF